MAIEPPQDVQNQVSELSRREREVAALVGRGLTIKEIVQRLGVAHRTVCTHLEHIRLKLRASNMATIAAWATRAGLIDHPDWYDERGRYVGPRSAA